MAREDDYLGARFGSSRVCPIRPHFKRSVYSSEHFSVNLPLIGKLRAPACVISFFAFKLIDEFLYQHTLVSVLVPGDAACTGWRLPSVDVGFQGSYHSRYLLAVRFSGAL